jgi:hypothetical protein
MMPGMHTLTYPDGYHFVEYFLTVGALLLVAGWVGNWVIGHSSLNIPLIGIWLLRRWSHIVGCEGEK